MSSRDYIKHLVANTSSLPGGKNLGDEVFDPALNKLYKNIAVNGTTVTPVELVTTISNNVANSASFYANGAFGAANSSGSYANSAFAIANTATPAGSYANSAFAKANSRVTLITDGTTLPINTDTTDIAYQINTQAAGTLTISVSGTPVNGQKLIIRIKSTNAQTFAFSSSWAAGSTDLTLPTVSSGLAGVAKTDYMGFIYNTTETKWHIIAKNFGF